MVVTLAKMQRHGLSSITALVVAASALGCDTIKSKVRGASDGDAGEAVASPSPTTPGNADAKEYDPCEILSAAIVAQAFPEMANVTFEDTKTLRALDRAAKGQAPKKPASEHRRESMSVGLGAVCNYSWPKPDAAAIQARNQAKSKEVVARSLKPQEKGGVAGGLMAALSELESDRASVSLALTRKKPSATAAAARATYEERLQTLRRGLKGKDLNTDDIGIDAGKAVNEVIKGIQVPPDTTLTDVAGIGDAAAWSTKSRTLHVLSGTHVFNVSIDAKDDVNRAKAEAVAKAVIGRL